jgi:hypothetical protein
MATIYTNAQGIQVYDYNGATYNAKTGQIVTGTTAPPTNTITPIAAQTTQAPTYQAPASPTSAPPTSPVGETVNFFAPDGSKMIFDSSGNLWYANGTFVGNPQIGGDSPMYRSSVAAGQTALAKQRQAAQPQTQTSAPANTSNLTPSSPNWYELQPGETISAYNDRINKANPGMTSTTTNTAPVSGGGGIPYDPSWAQFYPALTQDIWNGMNAVQQAQVGLALSTAKNMYSTTGSTVTLDQALKAAASDPSIVSQYADAQKLDVAGFQQSLQQLQTATSTNQKNLQTQFENERRALSEQQAAAGTAYSGFRGRAQEQLAQQEQGIVTSSRAKAQQSLQDLTTQFEQKYGSAATQAATMPFLDPYAASGVSLSGQTTPGSTMPTSTLAGQLTGGITGSQVTGKTQAEQQLASSYVTAGQVPNVNPVKA